MIRARRFMREGGAMRRSSNGIRGPILRAAGGLSLVVILFAAGCSSASTSSRATTSSTIRTSPVASQVPSPSLASASTARGCPSTACSTVLHEVELGTRTTTLPGDLAPPLQNALADLRMPPGYEQCDGSASLANTPNCIIGSPTATKRIVLFGDSHAKMWSTSMAAIAAASHSSLLLLVHAGCPVSNVAYGGGVLPYATCSAWIQWAIHRMAAYSPTLVVVTTFGAGQLAPNGTQVPPSVSEAGLAAVLKEVASPGRRLALIGDIPYLSQDGRICLAAHSSNVQACSTPTGQAVRSAGDTAQEQATASVGGSYVDVVPWFCTATVCPAVIGHYGVYENRFHATATYASSLAPLLQNALNP